MTMDFKQAIITCFQKYATFDGRASRSEFWWFALFSFLVTAAGGVLGEVVQGLVSLALLVPSLAVGARRLHDIGKSGWFLLIWLIPLVGWIIMIYWACQPSVGANEYGEPPAHATPPALPPGAV